MEKTILLLNVRLDDYITQFYVEAEDLCRAKEKLRKHLESGSSRYRFQAINDMWLERNIYVIC